MQHHTAFFRVVVVDDNRDDLVLLKEAILAEELPLRMIPFTDPKDALFYLQTSPKVDIVMADLNMGQMSGIDLLTKLTKDPAFLDVKLVISSSSALSPIGSAEVVMTPFPFLKKSNEWSGYRRVAHALYVALVDKSEWQRMQGEVLLRTSLFPQTL